MKAMLLRVGIDKGCGGALSPIFEDGSFEYIPIPESDPETNETRTYQNTHGRKNKSLADFLPAKICNDKMHFDPEFETFTYGDPSSKRNWLLKLDKNDLLVFYAGLTSYENDKHPNALYIIGYFVVDDVIDFNMLSGEETIKFCNLYCENAHIKRKEDLKDLVIVVGNKKKSKLLNKAILISEPKPSNAMRLGCRKSFKNSLNFWACKNSTNFYGCKNKVFANIENLRFSKAMIFER